MKTISNQFFRKPATKLGEWSIWLEVAFVVMFIVNVALQLLVFEYNTAFFQTIEPLYMIFVIFMLACGVMGGVFGMVATTRKHERSSLVWLAIIIGLFVLLLILNELIQLVQYLQGV